MLGWSSTLPLPLGGAWLHARVSQQRQLVSASERAMLVSWGQKGHNHNQMQHGSWSEWVRSDRTGSRSMGGLGPHAAAINVHAGEMRAQPCLC